MAVTSTVTITGSKSSDGVATVAIGPVTQTNSDAPANTTTQSFSAGTYAAITLPTAVGTSAVKGVFIIPPSNNTGTITLMGANEVGVALHKTEFSYLRLDTSAAPGLKCANAITVEFVWV